VEQHHVFYRRREHPASNAADHLGEKKKTHGRSQKDIETAELGPDDSSIHGTSIIHLHFGIALSQAAD
jgi:hypothetical protein